MGPWTAYQYSMFGTTARQTPDLSFDADPASGVYVYDSYGYSGWLVVGGTSVASPSLAGIVITPLIDKVRLPRSAASIPTRRQLIYSQEFNHTNYSQNFYDVTTGSNGTGHNAGPYYDQCTGVGTPRGKLGK